MIKLTYEEWKEKYSASSPDQATISDFQKFHGVNLLDEIEKANKANYEWYLQQFEAEIE